MAAINVILPDIAAEIKRAGELATDTRGALETVAQYLARNQEERMSAGDFPPPLKPGTIAKKTRRVYPETTHSATGAPRPHMV